LGVKYLYSMVYIGLVSAKYRLQMGCVQILLYQ
jgi:hypothetical protein